MNLAIKCFALASLVAGVVGGRAESPQAGYQCAGDYLLEVMWHSEKFDGFTNAGTFEVSFNKCKWRIAVSPTRPGDTHLGEEDYEAVYDGESIYQFAAIHCPPEFAGKCSDSGKIVNGPVPQRLDQRIQYIWLGTASGCFFDINSKGYVRALALGPSEEKRHDNFRLEETDWGYHGARKSQQIIPDWIAYKNSWRYKGEISQDSDDRLKEQTNVFFEVTSRTNIANISLPKAFTVTQFLGGKPTLRMSCLVKSVSDKGSDNISMPQLSGNTVVLDRRLTNQEPYLTVQLITKRWPSLNETETAYKGLIRNRLLHPSLPAARLGNFWRKLVVLAAIMAFSIVAFIFLRQQLKTSNQN